MSPRPTLQDLIDSVRIDAARDDVLAQLSQASRTVCELEQLSDELLAHFVDQSRRRGYSWTEISSALGVSKQAAHKRFSAGAPAMERFTDRARAVLTGAAEEARRHGHGSVGTEHVLLALFEPCDSVAARVLGEAGLRRSIADERVMTFIERRTSRMRGPIPMAPSSIGVVRGAVSEALKLGHNYVGTEHILLSLFLDPETPAAQALATFGLRHDQAKTRIVEMLMHR